MPIPEQFNFQTVTILYHYESVRLRTQTVSKPNTLSTHRNWIKKFI